MRRDKPRLPRSPSREIFPGVAGLKLAGSSTFDKNRNYREILWVICNMYNQVWIENDNIRSMY